MVFDITLPQIALVFVVGAATLGPKDLPRAARSIGFVVGRAARYLKEGASTATRVMQEAEIPELKQEIQQSMKDMENIRTQIKTATRINVLDSFGHTMDTSSAGPSNVHPSAREERAGRSVNAPPAAAPSLSSSAIDYSTEFLSRRGTKRASNSTSIPQDHFSGKEDMDPLERELELQLRQIDATQPQRSANAGAPETRTELLPSGADLVLECLRQQKFHQEVRETFRRKMMSPSPTTQQPTQSSKDDGEAKDA